MSPTSPLLNVRPGLRADPPQRYLGNYSRYLARGGRLRLEEELAAFTAGGANQGDMARFYFFCLAFDQLVKEGIHGQLAELGVYKGNTAGLLAGFARRLGTTAYLLDTYEGFSDRDLTGIDADAKPQSFSDTSLQAVRALVGEDNVAYVKGFFPATVAELPVDGTYCLVHIDCDLHAPMAAALDYFYPRMVPGGFLIVHDYASLHWNGAEKAVDAFFAGKPECIIPLPDGAGSIAVRKARSIGGGDNWLDRKRRALLTADWSGAGNGRLADLLGAGWSGPEEWGVWGVDALHVLHLVAPHTRGQDLCLEFDVQAALAGTLADQAMEVSVSGLKLADWVFTVARNRGVRALRVPASMLPPAGPAGLQLDVAFRPRAVIRASALKAGGSDNRALGLGLHGIRLAGQ